MRGYEEVWREGREREEREERGVEGEGMEIEGRAVGRKREMSVRENEGKERGNMRQYERE